MLLEQDKDSSIGRLSYHFSTSFRPMILCPRTKFLSIPWSRSNHAMLEPCSSTMVGNSNWLVTYFLRRKSTCISLVASLIELVVFVPQIWTHQLLELFMVSFMLLVGSESLAPRPGSTLLYLKSSSQIKLRMLFIKVELTRQPLSFAWLSILFL